MSVTAIPRICPWAPARNPASPVGGRRYRSHAFPRRLPLDPGVGMRKSIARFLLVVALLVALSTSWTTRAHADHICYSAVVFQWCPSHDWDDKQVEFTKEQGRKAQRAFGDLMRA